MNIVLNRRLNTKYYVYILECADKSFYVGCTNNLEKRLLQHNGSKSGAHYTKIRRPVKLVYSEKYKNPNRSQKSMDAILQLTAALMPLNIVIVEELHDEGVVTLIATGESFVTGNPSFEGQITGKIVLVLENGEWKISEHTWPYKNKEN